MTRYDSPTLWAVWNCLLVVALGALIASSTGGVVAWVLLVVNALLLIGMLRLVYINRQRQ